MRTVVINLAHRTDRRRAMVRQLTRIGWKAEFFQAIRPSSAGGFPSIGARGCFLSHLAVLKLGLGSDRLCILEDDLDLAPDFSERWPGLMRVLDRQPWSIFYAGHILKWRRRGLTRLEPEDGVLCSHFMLINGAAVPRLVHGLEEILARPPGHSLGGPMHVDGAYSTIRAQNPDLITYAEFPALGHQRPSRTDVWQPRWFDRIGGLQAAASVARSMKIRLGLR